MKEKQNLNELAFPVQFNDGIGHDGLTKHEYATIAITSAIVSNYYTKTDNPEVLKEIADRASKLAEIILTK